MTYSNRFHIRLLSVITLVLIGLQLFGQGAQFEFVPSQQPYTWTEAGFPFAVVRRCELGDIDGDGDLDFLYVWALGSGPNKLSIYKNDGVGNYALDTVWPFPIQLDDKFELLDIDGDGDLDLYSSKSVSSSPGNVHTLYENDGTGVFSEVTNDGITENYWNPLIWGDLDLDGDQDFIALYLDEYRIYEHVDSMRFSRVGSVNLYYLSHGQLSLGDLNGDGRLDLLATGRPDTSQIKIVRAYLNDSLWSFTDSTLIGLPAEGIYSCVNLNQDSLADLVYSEGNQMLRLFENDTAGVFIEHSQNNFGLKSDLLKTADVDNDGDEDLLLGRLMTGGRYIQTAIFENIGGMNFQLKDTHDYTYKNERYDIEFGDIDGDGDLDIMEIRDQQIDSYFNNGQGEFYYNLKSSLQSFSAYNGKLADIDGDGDLDAVLAGCYPDRRPVTRVFFNNGSGQFSPSTDTNLISTGTGDLDLADIDGDGDLDLMIVGEINRIYLNDGTGKFIGRSNFVGHRTNSAITFFDADGDSDMDLFFSGQLSSGTILSRYYINDGFGNFSLVSNHNLPDVAYGKIRATDIDNDGDNDLVMLGLFSDRSNRGYVCINDGSGNFTRTNLPANSGFNPQFHLADFNGDGVDDFLYQLSSGETDLRLNSGTGVLVKQLPVIFQSAKAGSIHSLDFDNDGDLDIVDTDNSNVTPQTLLYQNDGTGTMQAINNTEFDHLSSMLILTGDLDNDGDEDILFGGPAGLYDIYDWGRNEAVQIYLNKSIDLSIPGISSEPQLGVIYPNPSSGNFSIDVEEGVRIDALRIVSVNGVEVYTQPVELAGNLEVNIDVPPGVYIVILESEIGVQQELILME
ncbi:MAG: T9SS type A sorting domain-containing protein [Flavobacteriia bacterium]|nr:T9SS type A sorting domain-containing protein [Flavobacteriia bacterium]